MDEQLEEELVEEFPEIFELYKADPKRFDTGYGAPPICVYGFQVGDGWFNLLWDFAEEVSELDDSVRFDQIKEKFGGIRLYHQGVPSNKFSEFQEIRKKAKERAYSTCELCGDEGELYRDGGWLRVRCDDCYDPPGSNIGDNDDQ